jgi:hypothetical protein
MSKNTSLSNQNQNNKIEKLANQFSIAWSPVIFYTVRGAENIHIYFWILKDLGWSLNNVYLEIIF